MAKTAADDLYEADFYEWTRAQADGLRLLARERPNVPLDLPNLIEEVEDWGRSLKSSVASQLRRVIEHCLKLEHSLAWEPRRGWRLTVGEARSVIDDKITPALRREIERDMPRIYQTARKRAADGLDVYGESHFAEALPKRCPYALDDLIRDDWFPSNRHGIDDTRRS